jgi:YidC/Oxa1 family membrane protein insertase
MDFIGTILWPLRWVVEAILVGFHNVLVVRAALIPIFVRQIKSQRRMMEIAPRLKKIQDKYKGKRDQFSREAMSRETMALYKDTGTNPLSSCLPLLIQMPIFFSLYTVLHNAQQDKVGIGLLNQALSTSFGESALFGAPLKETFLGATTWEVRLMAGIMVVVMTASQFITQLQIVSKNMSPETKASPMFKQQRMLLYFLPLVFVFSGLSFPLGVMFYWLTSNIWTMAQQFIVIRNMPTPGSEAALAREERLAKKAQRKGLGLNDITVTEIESAPAVPKQTQRVQPVGKNRAKKQNGAKK